MQVDVEGLAILMPKFCYISRNSDTARVEDPKPKVNLIFINS